MPTGTSATLDLAGREPRLLDSGTHRFDLPVAVTALAS